MHFVQMRDASSFWAAARLGELEDAWTKHEKELFERKKKGLNVGAQLEVARQFLIVFQDAIQQVPVQYVYEIGMFKKKIASSVS